MSKQTAVEWFYEQIDNIIPFVSNEHADKFNSLFQQAKEMEKEIMIQFSCDVFNKNVTMDASFSETAKQFYKETYGGANE